MGALDRKLWRDFWRLRGPVLAIALVIACGVGSVVMAFGTIRSLEATRDAYYERYRFAEVFAPVKRAPEGVVKKIARIPGVARVEARIVDQVILDVAGMAEPVSGRLISYDDRGRPLLNAVALRRGRMLTPGRRGEALVSENFAEAHRLEPGDHLFAIINGHKRKLRIAGIVLSPEYIYALGGGQIMPDDRRFGVLWMGRDELEAAYDLKGAFNEVTLSLRRTAVAQDVVDRLDALLDPYGGTGAYLREDQLSHSFLSSEMDQLRMSGRIIPPIFLGVAAFLLNIVVSRLIQTEREQIGLLKAFGYSNYAVGWHYLKFVLLLTVIGIILGFLFGLWLGQNVTEMYTRFFRFPFLYYRVEPGVFAAAALVSIVTAVGGTLMAVRQAVRLAPAVAMVPPAPAAYRTTLLERLGALGQLNQPARMILRNVGRRPLRAGFTILGMALSGAVLIGSLFSLDSIDHMIEVTFYQAQRQHIVVNFGETHAERVVQEVRHLPGVLTAEGTRDVPVRLRFGARSERQSISGLEPGAQLSRLIDVSLRPVALPAEGLVLSTKLAALLGAGRGDLVTVEALEGRRPVGRLRVSAVVEEYIGVSAYMDRRALNRFMQEGPAVSGANLLLDLEQSDRLFREIKDTPSLAGISFKTAIVKAFRDTIAESLLIILTFYVLFAGTIAFGVVYNSARIGLSERGRELASLRVLGFTEGEVAFILLGELVLLVLVSLPLGCLLGYGLAAFISFSMDTDLFRVPLVIDRSTYGYSLALMLAATLATVVILRRRIDALDLISVLKTRE